MRTRKLRLTGIILLIFSMLLAACGGDAPTTDKKELNMWTWKIAHVPGLKEVAKNFEAKTGIKVNVTAYNPDDVYRTKITTAAQSEELPDILSYWSNGQWELASNGLLLDITDKVDSNWKNSFLGGTFEKTSVYPQETYDVCQKDPKCTSKNAKVGRVYSVPYMAGQAMFAYGNKTLMKQAGLDPNSPPKTAEEWLDMMKTIKAKTGQAGLVTGVKNQNVLNFWLFRPLLMTSCGVETYDAIFNGESSFTDPCATRVLNWINEVGKNKLWTADILQTDIDPADVAFSQGKSGFDIGGTYTLSFLLAQGMKSEDILSFPIPALKDAKYSELKVNAISLIDAGVTKDSKYPAEAVQFLQFLTSAEQMAVFAKTVGDLPATKIEADSSKVGPVIPGLLKGLSETSPFIQSKAQAQDEPNKILELGLQKFITGETQPDALAKQVDAANKSAWASKKK